MDKIKLFQSVPIFTDLSRKSLETITSKAIVRNYAKNGMIIMERDKGESFFVIEKGIVKVTRVNDRGQEVILAILGEGDFFGEMALLDGEGRSANIVAVEDTTALVLPRNDFLHILEQFPKIAIHLLQELTKRIRRSDQQIESLSLSAAEQRISMTLSRLAEEMGTIKNGIVTLYNMPYQQDIANMAGTSRETVSRTLRKFEKSGIIKKEGKTIYILDFSSFNNIFE